MSVPVLIGFAGVLVAAVATGVLAGRCVRQPRIYLILWTAATLGLAVALAAQSMGFASGFGLATFRAVQLPAQLLAPLWLAWGLVELVAASEAARFGMRLVSSALTVVGRGDPGHRPAHRAAVRPGPGRSPARTSSRSRTTRWTRCRSWRPSPCWRAWRWPWRGPGKIRAAAGADRDLPGRPGRAGGRGAAPAVAGPVRLSAAQLAGGGARLVRRDQGPASPDGPERPRAA